MESCIMALNEVSEMGCSYWTTREIILSLREEEEDRSHLSQYGSSRHPTDKLKKDRRLQDATRMKAATFVRLPYAALRMIMMMMTEGK